MQFVSKLTQAPLNDVPKDARSNTYGPTVNPHAISKLLLRCLSVPIALTSIASASLEGTLSVGFYGAAMLLGKVRPLRKAYQFLSRAYDRFIGRLGQEVLRDSRDTPALRIMVSLTLTALPIFVIQLILGKPRLLLVIAFYLSLCGPKFQRSVRMFSAKHLEAHRPQGYFSDRYDRLFGRYVEFFLGYLYGTFPNWDGPFMSVSTIRKTADPTIMLPPWATIERIHCISFGIFLTTFGPRWGLLHTPTSELDAM